MGMRISVALLLLAGLAMPAAAQGKGPKKYAVSTDQALVVTKDVLVKQGYEVVRVENRGRDYVVWYRRGNKGRGKGKGPPVRDRKSTRLNSSHSQISYAVFCLKKKNKQKL